MSILLLNDKNNTFFLKETTATCVNSIFFSAKGIHESSFNDGTKVKNSGPTLSATTSIIFSAVVVVVSEFYEQILCFSSRLRGTVFLD